MVNELSPSSAASKPRVAIHQPQYWPWPGYIQKIMASDTFIYLDHVQFSKNGFQNRNQIKSATGAQWLSVPVKNEFGESILETKIADPRWAKKHFSSLTASYSKTPGFQRWKKEIEDLLLGNEYKTICEIAIETTEWLLQKLGVQNTRYRSSKFSTSDKQKSSLVSELCERAGAGVYLTGSGGLEYMAREDFEKIRCEVWLQRTIPFEYHQQFGKVGFVPHLSTLDLILNCPDEAGSLLERHLEWIRTWQVAK